MAAEKADGSSPGREIGMAQLGVRRKSTATASGDAIASIPDKLYFRIGEVSDLCGVPAYVLRFWESEFPQLRPNKGGTGQRLYRRRDVLTVLRIKQLLYEGGFTIPGARQMLAAEQRKQEQQLALSIIDQEQGPQIDGAALRRLRSEMQLLLEMLGGPAREAKSKVQSIRPARSRSLAVDATPDLFEERGTGR